VRLKKITKTLYRIAGFWDKTKPGTKHLVQSGKTASGGCSAGQGSSECSATDYYITVLLLLYGTKHHSRVIITASYSGGPGFKPRPGH
jgi:hypothetical protein